MKLKAVYDIKEEKVFVDPFLDKDEIQETSGKKIRVFHGGFRNTGLKFSICFPTDPKDFEGRFFQYLSPFPGPDEEIASFGKSGLNDMIGFAVSHGGAFVESNMAATMAFGNPPDATQFFRSSAAVANYCRQLAMEKMGYEGHVYGYVFGGSGGAYKTYACAEQTTIWDGAMPFVPGCPMALPNVIFARGHALRILRNKMDRLIDWIRPGADFDIWDELDAEEAQALKEVTAFGYPYEAWIQYKFAGDGSLPVLVPGVKRSDSSYFEEFWTKPGFLGTVEGSTAQRDRIRLDTKITEVHIPTPEEIQAETDKWAKLDEDAANDGTNGVNSAWTKMMETCEMGHPYIRIAADLGEGIYEKGLEIRVTGGEAEGKVLNLGLYEDGKLYIGKGFGPGSVEAVLKALKSGDPVHLDNSDYIAIQTYHRHQVPEPEYRVWDMYRNEDGTPKYPQRQTLLGYGFAYSGCGNIQTGQPACKTITLSSLADDSAFPWMAAWYDDRVTENFGEEKEDNYRLYYNEHTYHGYQQDTVDPTTVTSYAGILFQALVDLSNWVEKGIQPPKATQYKVENGQVTVPKNAKERCGIQPVVDVTVNGKKRHETVVGQPVHFEAIAEVPEGCGQIIDARFSFDGNMRFPGEAKVELLENGTKARITGEHTYDTVGTFFVTLQIMSAREEALDDIYTQVKNIDSMRIVVR